MQDAVPGRAVQGRQAGGRHRRGQGCGEGHPDPDPRVHGGVHALQGGQESRGGRGQVGGQGGAGGAGQGLRGQGRRSSRRWSSRCWSSPQQAEPEDKAKLEQEAKEAAKVLEDYRKNMRQLVDQAAAAAKEAKAGRAGGAGLGEEGREGHGQAGEAPQRTDNGRELPWQAQGENAAAQSTAKDLAERSNTSSLKLGGSRRLGGAAASRGAQ